MFEQHALARDQELRCGIIEAGALQLADGRAQFKNLGSQLQNPVRVRIFLHGEKSAARGCARKFDVLLVRTNAHALADIG